MKINIKKASVIISLIGFFLLGYSYYFMQKSTQLINKNDQAVLEIVKLIKSNKTEVSNALISPDNNDMYYYEDMNLNQQEHIKINECLQYYITEETFDNANKCEEIIVDAVIKNMGETEFIKAIIGNMISYKSDVFIKEGFPKILFDTGVTESSLKSKLMLTFINRYRDSIKLQIAFNNYKDYFFGSISENLYKKLFKNYINIFIDSYEEIHEQKDIESFYKSIYYKAETRNKHGEFWHYTFWKRRELENNDQTIYSILKEIKMNYEI